MSDLLAKACQETKDGNMKLKESVQHIGETFFNAAETSEQECCWDLLELPMTQSSVKVEFISTCPPDDRVFIAKDSSILQEMEPDSEDVKVAGKVKRYAKQPSKLEDWCLADYVQLDVLTRHLTLYNMTLKIVHQQKMNQQHFSDTNRTQQDIVQMQVKQNHLTC